MNKTILLVFIFASISWHVSAQEVVRFNSNMGLGFHLIQNQRDFGLGVNLTSPYFANDKVAIRARGNFMWYQHLDNTTTTTTTTWTPYSNLSLGIIGVGGEIGGFVRLYGEGGLLVLLPSNEFSSESSVLGGYGLFGVEFFMNNASNYLIEIGGIGTGAKADEIPGSPIYSNGLMISVGIRYTFK
jgi:hypothetical protein